MVANQYEVFEKTGFYVYSKWPLKVLKLACPDNREELTLTSAGVMLHHLLLPQYMNTFASNESKAAVIKVHADAPLGLSRPPSPGQHYWSAL